MKHAAALITGCDGSQRVDPDDVDPAPAVELGVAAGAYVEAGVP